MFLNLEVGEGLVGLKRFRLEKLFVGFRVEGGRLENGLRGGYVNRGMFSFV